MSTEVKPKRRSQAERREEAERRLVQAAIRLVAERGYDGFTLADVGEAAGYSRGLPAHYFGRKEDLLSLVAEYSVRGYHVSIAQSPPSERGLPQLTALIRRYVKVRSEADKTGIRSLVMLISESLVRPDLKKTIKRLNEQGIANLEEELRLGIAAGNIRSDVDVPQTARAIYAYLRGQLTFAVLHDEFHSSDVGEVFISMLEARLKPAPRTRRKSA